MRKTPKNILKITSLRIAVFLCFGLYCSVLTDCTPRNTTNHKTIDSDSSVWIPQNIDFGFHVKPILSDKCFACHGPDLNKVEAGLQLHTEEKAKSALGKSKDRYAIVNGDLENSQLINRIFSTDPIEIMPPPESNLKLTRNEKEILKRWIEQGANWKEHWSFIPPSDPEIPSIENKAWASNPIDNFILEKLSTIDLEPSPELSKQKLIRRLSFDLRGLPPSLEEINSFIEDDSERNYERIIDDYLSSDAFAEKMTNAWLDLARYADTHGYQDDLERIMWPWRDWVIHAFKQNMPYDQFVLWQIAGDLLPNASKEQIIATAFNRNHKITQEGGAIPEEYRAEYVTDRTNTFGTAFLGLTFECAKCHDHKYDPISQLEYFQLYSFFNNVDEIGIIEEYGQVPEPFLELSKEEIESTLSFIKNLDTLDNIPLMVMREKETPRETYVLSRGLYDRPTTLVKPVAPSFGKKHSSKKLTNRLDLSQWLLDDDNPLFARVMVNRLWQHIFGKGIVKTAFDFGSQGALPTHPELLDHLAVKFKNDDWDIQSILKYILMSSTYKQESKVSSEMLTIDPDNNYYARANRARLSAEMIRDHALSISGLLVEEVGGPSVKPYQPEGLWNEVAGGGNEAVYIQDEGKNNYRRSLYTFWKRTVPPPNMILFDTPTRDICSVQREQTSTPLQALVLLNDPQYLEASSALAKRALKKTNGKPEQVIQYMFNLATSRKALDIELNKLIQLYDFELDNYKNDPKAMSAWLSFFKENHSSTINTENLAAYSYIANTILNLDETIRK